MEINDFFDGLFLCLGLRRDEKNRKVSDKVQFLGIKRNKYLCFQGDQVSATILGTSV